MNPFAVNYEVLSEVIDLARSLHKLHPRFRQVVVKYPNRSNYNITMQVPEALAKGAAIVWDSTTTK